MTKMSLKLVLVFVCLNSVTDLFVKSEDNVIKTTSGSVKGLTIDVFNQKIEQFLGIPFAEPPVGSLRFAKPKPISKVIKGVIDATKTKNSCLQPEIDLVKDFIGNLTQNEDCLTLNIWTQTSEKKNSTKLKPVMFWIYGGALILGSTFQTLYNGSVLATQDVVFVSTNYRLGRLGFLYGGQDDAPGNLGFYDQNLALKWVRENIHLFGGDKNQITIFGESAGSWSVSAHLLSPLSKGLFKRAIMESGAHMYNNGRPIVSKEEALISAKNFAKQMNCTDDKKWLDCLRKVDAKKLIPNSLEFVFPLEGTEFIPLSAQKAFSQKKFNKDLELMAGVTKDEGSGLAASIKPDVFSKNLTKDDFTEFVKTIDPLFHNLDLKKVNEFYLNNTNLNDSDAIRWKIFDIFGDLLMKCPTYRFAKSYSEHSTAETNVFFYELTHNANAFNKNIGIPHGADIPFVFGSLLLQPKTSEENIRFTKEVMKLWTDFAKYGKPDNNWPKLIDSKSHSSVTQIKDLTPNNSHKYLNDFFDQTCDGFWKNYF